ncbi:MAG: hypothetical protein LBL86_07395 [Coriobacteriales bacterium]|jgi:hypothetical protein|nr:hypothetical protein [Coriobacteriales bacterium]
MLAGGARGTPANAYEGVVDMDGYIAIALVGVIFFVAGLVLRRARITKSREERMEEYYRDYQQRMDKFRKQ